VLGVDRDSHTGRTQQVTLRVHRSGSGVVCVESDRPRVAALLVRTGLGNCDVIDPVPELQLSLELRSSDVVLKIRE